MCCGRSSKSPTPCANGCSRDFLPTGSRGSHRISRRCSASSTRACRTRPGNTPERRLARAPSHPTSRRDPRESRKPMTVHTTRMLIIGSGPAGFSAAIYGARAGMQPIVVQGLQPGGQLTITTDVENYPGFADVIQGPWLMEQMQKQAEHVGTRLFFDVITEVDFTRHPFRAVGDSGDIYTEIGRAHV